MQGVRTDSIYRAQSMPMRQAAAAREPASLPVEGGKRNSCRHDAGPGCRPELKQAVYQSVVVVLRERFTLTAAKEVPAAGLSPAEQADNRLASAVGSALTTTAAGEEGQVSAAVEQGLEEALGSSAAVPAEADAAADLVSDIRGRVQSLVAAFVASRESGVPEAVTAAKVTTRERGVLEIRTQEGDMVRIDFRNTASAKLSSATTADGTSESLKIRVSERTSLQVQGDLSSEELAAIGDLVAKVDALADDFFAGDVEQAFAAAGALAFDDSQLAQYSLQLSMSQKVKVRMTEMPTVAAQPARVPDASDAAVPVPASGAVVEPSEAPEAGPGAVESQVSTDTTPPATANEGAPIAAAGVATAREMMSAFVARLRASFAMSTTDAGLGLTASVKLKVLVAALEADVRSTPATPAAVKTLEQAAEASLA